MAIAPAADTGSTGRSCYLSRRSLFLLNNVGGIAGVYRIPNIEAGVTGVFTNTMTNAPYRGAGRPEATYVIERLIDIAARDLGLDPFEFKKSADTQFVRRF